MLSLVAPSLTWTFVGQDKFRITYFLIDPWRSHDSILSCNYLLLNNAFTKQDPYRRYFYWSGYSSSQKKDKVYSHRECSFSMYVYLRGGSLLLSLRDISKTNPVPHS